MFVPILWLAITVCVMWINSSRAKKYNRSVGGWMLAGLFFGIFSTIVLLLLGENSKEVK